MLDISDEVKSLFLKDSTKKKIVIEVDSPDGKDISDFNYYLGTPTFGYAWNHEIEAGWCQAIMCGYPYTSDFKDYADLQWDVCNKSASVIVITSDKHNERHRDIKFQMYHCAKKRNL